jgi:hypothetical protein
MAAIGRRRSREAASAQRWQPCIYALAAHKSIVKIIKSAAISKWRKRHGVMWQNIIMAAARRADVMAAVLAALRLRSQLSLRCSSARAWRNNVSIKAAKHRGERTRHQHQIAAKAYQAESNENGEM